jgi:hypothetical protein
VLTLKQSQAGNCTPSHTEHVPADAHSNAYRREDGDWMDVDEHGSDTLKTDQPMVNNFDEEGSVGEKRRVDEEENNDEEGNVDTADHAPRLPCVDEPGIWSPDPPPFSRRQHHGYATVEVHPTAARVIRWEYVDERSEPSAADILRQREAFKLGEWLARLPISDRERARYFEIKRVSAFHP